MTTARHSAVRGTGDGAQWPGPGGGFGNRFRHPGHSAAEATARALPSAAGALEWIVEAAISGVLGLLIGAATLPIVEFAVAPAWKGLKRLLPGRRK